MAKIPNKPADIIAAESKARAEQKAKWQAESARNQRREAVDAAAAATDAVETDFELDAVPPPPAKSSGGCSPDAEEKIDPTVVEFKD